MSPLNPLTSVLSTSPRSTDMTSAAEAARSQFVRGYSLPQYYYTSDERYARDVEISRQKHWLLADHESVIPEVGSFVVRNCAGESLIIVRDKARRVRAFHNVCRHRGSVLCMDEQGKTRAFVCPYHAWNFGLDGSLRAARSMPEDFDTSQFGLLECNVAIFQRG